MTENCFFSIITVCFNSADTIEDTIKSVINQTYQNYEYIIIDGKSTDGTLDIIKKYAELYPSKIRYVSEPDNGIYDAMNKGIINANGNLIGIINSDDYYECNALEIISKSVCDDKFAVYYGMLRFLKNNHEYQIIMNNHAFLDTRMICHPSCFVTKATYDEYGLFSLKYRSASDYEFMLRLKNKGSVHFIPVYHILSNMRLGGISFSNIGVIETLDVKYQYQIIDRPSYRRGVRRIKVKAFMSSIKKRILNLCRKGKE